jgi:hypothetical protein
LKKKPRAFKFAFMSQYHASIVVRLQRAKRHWRMLAIIADVPYPAFTTIASGTTQEPRIEVLEKIERALYYFEKLWRAIDREIRDEFARKEFKRLQQRAQRAEERAAKHDGGRKALERIGAAVGREESAA